MIISMVSGILFLVTKTSDTRHMLSLYVHHLFPSIQWRVLQAEEKHAPDMFTTSSLTIQVTDVNDSPPQFEHSSYSVSVAEHSSVGTVIARLEAIDGDMVSCVCLVRLAQLLLQTVKTCKTDKITTLTRLLHCCYTAVARESCQCKLLVLQNVLFYNNVPNYCRVECLLSDCRFPAKLYVNKRI